MPLWLRCTVHSDRDDEETAEQPSGSPEVPNTADQTTVDDPEQDTDVVAAAAHVEETPTSSDVQYHYGHHMLTSFTSALTPASSRATHLSSAHTPSGRKSLRPEASHSESSSPPRPTTRLLSIHDLFDNRWPSNFSIWEAHISNLMRPWLHKCRIRGGHAQSDLDQHTMMYITRAVAWLVVFSEEENPAALLTDLALLAHEAYDEGLSPQALLKERLEDMFALVPVQDRISKKEIYASMVETYKTMCEDDFGPELLEIYQPEDEPGSEPSDDSADQWVIPLPGEEGTVCRRRTLNSEAGEEPKLETDSPAQVLDSASAGPEASEDQNLIPDMETLDPKWVTTRPRVRYTYAVVKWTPLEDESPSYAIWAARAFSQRDKGVKVVKTCNRLHVAKNYVRQKEGANGPVAQRVASRSLIIYDPDSRVALQEVGKRVSCETRL